MRIPAFVCLILALTPSLAAVAQRDRHVFPVVFHVGESADGAPLVDHDALTAGLRETNRVMADANVCFAVHEVLPLLGVTRLVDIRARRALERQTRDGAVHVFVVDAIEDPRPSASTLRAVEAAGRTLGGLLGGAHVPRRADGSPSTYVLVTAGGVRAWTPLAHELGHVLGESHAADVTNLMSYGAERSGFDATQLARMERRGQRMARAHWVGSEAVCP